MLVGLKSITHTVIHDSPILRHISSSFPYMIIYIDIVTWLGLVEAKKALENFKNLLKPIYKPRKCTRNYTTFRHRRWASETSSIRDIKHDEHRDQRVDQNQQSRSRSSWNNAVFSKWKSDYPEWQQATKTQSQLLPLPVSTATWHVKGGTWKVWKVARESSTTSRNGHKTWTRNATNRGTYRDQQNIGSRRYHMMMPHHLTKYT